MKVPLSWLREYVDITISIPELVERMTLAGLEVASVRFVGLPIPEKLPVKVEEPGPTWQRDKIIVGEVLKVEQHPNADRLTLATVNYGAVEPKVVVTGAPNIKVGDKGQKVIVALSGSVLFDGHSEQKVLRELKPTKIRGIPSDSMVCSAYELGISEEHEGIILLDGDAAVGTPLADYMGDVVLEIDVLPNMARCLSMIGMAREVAALTGQALKAPKTTLPTGAAPIDGKVRVVIENPKLCARYAAMLIKDVKIGPAPGWMQRRLTNAGMRPISNLVDITNYVMLEWGQPLHAFDYDALVKRAGGKVPTITVRSARPGEVLITLDNQKRELTGDNLVIADQAGPIALAGVMGGLETEVSDKTTTILLESANFDFVSIRRTMKAFNLPSEASARFSRGIHPEIVQPAAERAADLMRQYASGTVYQGMVEQYPAPLPPQVIELTMSAVKKLTGVDFPIAEAKRILQSLEFHVDQTGSDSLKATTPPHRLDIQAGAADLIEELVRVHGYERLPATLLADQLPQQMSNPLALEERVRDILVDRGLQEIVTYSLTSPEKEAPLGLPEAEYVRLANPISSERVVMRHSLLAGMLDVTAANLRQASQVKLFEIGSVYLPMPGEKLPAEPRRLAFVLTGPRRGEYWGDGVGSPRPNQDFYDAKGVIEGLLADLHIDEVAYLRSSMPFLHPGKSAEIRLKDNVVGHFGQMHPKVAETYELGSNRMVLVGELDLDAILGAVPPRFAYEPVPRYPAALRDVAVVVDETITGEQIVKEIRAAGGDLLHDIRLFDLYRGESIPAGKKSLAYALTYLSNERTLTDKEVDKAHRKIEDRIRHVLKAQIRGKEE
ncbi:MAG TPA: phenylalanine--tRNA ligase subunit beta [Gemmataceae bacterium]|nr:phenylalanine--tRNA ligase subunit beta [Gemmataceae bacterium]